MPKTERIQEFIDTITYLYEPEYGDFKRKLGLYLERLVQSDPSLGEGQAKALIEQMRMRAIFDSSGDIEASRRQVLELSRRLLDLARGSRTH
jgi:hypothetical protein